MRLQAALVAVTSSESARKPTSRFASMNRVCNPERIRTLIHDTLVALGAEAGAREEESLLIRSGTYCGHRIDKDGMRAIWFIEEDQIKFYDRNGGMLQALVPSKVFSQKAA